MSEIQVATGDLHNGSQNLNGAANELGEVQSQLSDIPESVGDAYEGQLRQALEEIMGGAIQMGGRLQNRAVDLGNELFTRATGFEAANEAGRGAVLGVSTEYVKFTQRTSILGYLSFLSKIEKALLFWNMGGLAFGGVLSWIFLANKSSIPKQIIIPPPERISPSQNLKSVDVPYSSQWNEKKQNGGNNCGPAAVTMAINKFGKNIEYTDVVSKIRGANNSSGPTDFNSTEVDALLNKNGLERETVTDMSGLEEKLNKDYPVIILVDNSKYIRQENGQSLPYPNTSGYLQKHIIVITGYEKDAGGKIVAVYINDPLAVKLASPNGGRMVADPDTGKNFRVPINDFNAAAGKKWYASAIKPQS